MPQFHIRIQPYKTRREYEDTAVKSHIPSPNVLLAEWSENIHQGLKAKASGAFPRI